VQQHYNVINLRMLVHCSFRIARCSKHSTVCKQPLHNNVLIAAFNSVILRNYTSKIAE